MRSENAPVAEGGERKERMKKMGVLGANDGTRECGVAPGQTLKNPIAGERFTFV